MLLTVPNWSIYSPEELGEARARIERDFPSIRIHYWKGDPDHGRTVTAFSGDPDLVQRALLATVVSLLPKITLIGHDGVHPFVGGLDVCPFVRLDGASFDEQQLVEATAEAIWQIFHVPTAFYERQASSPENVPLPNHRRAGHPFRADVGGSHPHPVWGSVVMGFREFLLAVNIDLKTEDLAVAKSIAKKIRQQRELNETGFAGVRALGFELPSRGLVQVSMNLTLPNESSFDLIYGFVAKLAEQVGVEVEGTELIGVIRQSDLPRSTKLNVQPEQIVEMNTISAALR